MLEPKTSEQLRDIKTALRGSTYFAFSKGNKFFLYREAFPHNVCVVYAKSIVRFAARVQKITGRTMPKIVD